MVNIRFISVIIFLLFSGFFTGCASSTNRGGGAIVEDRTQPDQTKQKLPESQKQETLNKQPEPLPEEKKSAPVPLSEPEVVITPPAPQEPIEQKSSPAVVALLDNADQYSASGKNEQAIASIERAIRIEPKNPLLWHKLGRIRLEQGNWDQAIAMAKKSNVLATGNTSLQAQNWLIIANARNAKGDKPGAEQALDMVRQLK